MTSKTNDQGGVKLSKAQRSMLSVAQKIGYMWPGPAGASTARSLVNRKFLSRNFDGQYRITPAGLSALTTGEDQ